MKNKVVQSIIIASLFALAGCASTTATETKNETQAKAAAPAASEPKQAELVRPAPPPAKKEMKALTFGRGIVKADGMDVNFMLNVSVFKDDTAEGKFAQSAATEAGTYDIEADVLCATMDNEKGRGWIAGKIIRNGSSNPLYAGDAGTEVWFRILDRNRDEQQPMISILERKSSRIASASEFCKKTPWPKDGLHLVDPGAMAIFP